MKRLFLGDIHGDWNVLNRVLLKYKDTPIIQVGDMGLGFPEMINVHNGKPFDNDPKELPANFKFIRGNHDNPEKCRQFPNYLGDYGIDKETGIFYLSGAWSIDLNYRTPGLDWWYDEELDYQDLQKAIDLYIENKPNVVVSHTCPSSICNILLKGQAVGSRTEKALESMWEVHRPRYFVFGHWHQVWRKTILNTEFICCAINQIITLDF